ncbi:COP9 signalosome complex subunit 10 [Nakaseomyces bracarensis]|uniref:COP9 signalosome complex subunit 10 n=1 Tax=Nakaseomyces bracarensis TaxID=273131 RepID=A0ABR4NTJ7_9SACH
MSDESDNYDEFMMSEDDMDSIEMEDEETDNIPRVESNTSDIKYQMEQYQRGLNLLDDEEYLAARTVFVGLLEEGNVGDELSLQINCHIIRGWCRLLMYTEPEDSQCVLIQEDFQRFIAQINCLHGKKVSLDLEQEFVTITQEFQSSLTDRIFIFNVSEPKSHELLKKLRFKREIFGGLQTCWVYHKYPLVKESLNGKMLIMQYWIDMLSDHTSADVDTGAMLRSFGSTQLSLDQLQLVLQCFISKYLDDQEIQNSEGNIFRDCIRQLEEISNDSLAIAQRSDINLTHHFCKALYLIVFEMDQEEMVSVNSDDKCIRRFVTISKFYQNIENCKEEFWECLKSLEELGTNKFHFDKFMQVIIGGFVLCSMILKKPRAVNADGGDTGNNDINPFEYEQLRIAPDHEFMGKLQVLYEVFTTLRVDQMYQSLVDLECIGTPLSRLFDQICYLVQKRKLFDEIAPVYSCISISDLRQMIQIHPAMPPSRDEILIHLMRYRMQDRGIDFRLDLTEDVVYFLPPEGGLMPLHTSTSPAQGTHDDTSTIAGIARLLPNKIRNPTEESEYNQVHLPENVTTSSFFDTLRLSREKLNNRETDLYIITKLTTDSLS